MNRFFRLIYSNKLFAFIMLFVQIAILTIGYFWLDEFYFYVRIVMTVLSLGLAIYEINKTGEPEFKIAWIMLIAFIPIFGTVLYMFLHLAPMSGELNRAYFAQQCITRKFLQQDEDVMEELNKTHKQAPGLAKYLKKYSGSPVYTNTNVGYFSEGQFAINKIIEDIKLAEDFIFLEFFIINQAGQVWPKIEEELKKKAAMGVEVRVLYDGMGCLNILPSNYPQILRKEGIQCKVFSPIMPMLSTYQNNRDHRKICVIDGKVGYCGGINLADEYANLIERFGYWKDSAIRLEGDAVAALTALFLEMWNCGEANLNDRYEYYINKSILASNQNAAGFVIPFGDSPLDNNFVGKRVYMDNLNNAKKYVHIMTPYLVIDHEMYETMKYAAQRGVEVKIIMPHVPDKPYAFYIARTYYKELLEAGIQIYEYTPGFVHSKISVADGERAIVGTINHDFRSLYLHYECAVYLLDVPQIDDIEKDFCQTLQQCEEITLLKYKAIPKYQKLFGQVARILAPLI